MVVTEVILAVSARRYAELVGAAGDPAPRMLWT
jgi:hypothetical protein